MKNIQRLTCFLAASWLVGVPPSRAAAPAERSSGIQFQITATSAKALPCRIHVKDDQGMAQRADHLPFWRDHFVCDGNIRLHVPPGVYSYEIERGPEFMRRAGKVTVEANAVATVAVQLDRLVNLRQRGWYSGDLHVHRNPEEIELLMRAEDVDFAPVITWWNARNRWQNEALPQLTSQRFDGHRWYTVMAGEDERQGGALLYFGLDRPLDLSAKSREVPSPMLFVQQAHQQQTNVWIDIEKPFWWDVPTWLASQQMNSIGVANNHMCRSQMYESEAWGRPRDEQRLPAPRGNGFWTQEIYYHMLEAGLRLPPSAGSASGVLPNPVGYNRVYVQLDDGEQFSPASWFRGLSQGRCFVTNGPLLQVRANGQLPGATLKSPGQQPSQVELSIELTSVDPIPYLEVIHNGRIVKEIPLEEANQQQQTVTLSLDGPGWLLVRAIADVDHTFRFASTAPWFLEGAAAGPRISRKSAKMFLDWVDQRIMQVQASVTDPEALRSVLEPHQKARVFWAQRVEAANAE